MTGAPRRLPVGNDRGLETNRLLRAPSDHHGNHYSRDRDRCPDTHDPPPRFSLAFRRLGRELNCLDLLRGSGNDCAARRQQVGATPPRRDLVEHRLCHGALGRSLRGSTIAADQLNPRDGSDGRAGGACDNLNLLIGPCVHQDRDLCLLAGFIIHQRLQLRRGAFGKGSSRLQECGDANVVCRRVGVSVGRSEGREIAMGQREVRARRCRSGDDGLENLDRSVESRFEVRDSTRGRRLSARGPRDEKQGQADRGAHDVIISRRMRRWSFRRRVFAWVRWMSWVGLLSACSQGAYRPVVEWGEGVAVAEVDRLELSLVESCDAQPSDPSMPPQNAFETLVASRVDAFPAFRRVADGTPGGLLARAFDSVCGQVAWGCEPIELVPGGSGDVVVRLNANPRSRCGPAQLCENDTCRDPIGCEVDGVRCSAANSDGVCHEGQCCAGCWDGARCRSEGTREACGVLGQACRTCDGDQMCERGSCVDEVTPIPCSEEGSTCEGGAGICRSGACCTGCWDGAACLTGVLSEACGVGGGACTECVCPNNACEAGACTESVGVIDAAMGGQHGCIVDSESRLVCWGSNGFSETGVVTTSIAGVAPTVVRCIDPGCTDLGPWEQVFAGDATSCALAADGAFACWGKNTMTAPLNPSAGLRDNIPAPLAFDDDTFVRRDVALGPSYNGGDNHVCFLSATNQLRCLGTNGSGQLGDGSLTLRDTPTLVEAIPGRDNTYLEVATSHQSTCAIDTDDALFCWGNNAFGQLGLGDRLHRDVPTLVDEGPWRELRPGKRAFCAIKANRILCWGSNSQGDLAIGLLGVGSTTERVIDVPTPLDYAGAAVAFDLGGGYGTLVDDAGALFSWGWNDKTSAEVSLGRTLLPVPPGGVDVAYVRPVRVEAAGTGWREVTLGDSHTCAIAQDRSIWCAGRNFEGQLGLGPDSPATPTMDLARVCLPPPR